MENCKNCIVYDLEYDELIQSGDDIIIEGVKKAKKHYCRLFEKGIPKEIWDNKTKCQHNPLV